MRFPALKALLMLSMTHPLDESPNELECKIDSESAADSKKHSHLIKGIHTFLSGIHFIGGRRDEPFQPPV